MKALSFLSVLTLLFLGCDRREELQDQQKEEIVSPEKKIKKEKKTVIPRDTAPKESLPKVIQEGQEEAHGLKEPDEHDSSMGSGTNAYPYGSPTEDSGVRE